MSGSGPDWAAREWAVDAARLAPARRKRKFPTGACQVQGCTAQLDARFHKICAVHLKAPQVAIDGRDMRFCQKCAKFEALKEFEGVKRTCQRALAAHNLARQRRKARGRGGAAPGSGRGTGSESSVSAPATARSGAPAASASAAVAAAGMCAADAGASQAAVAPLPGLRPASGSLFGSQQASVAGLGEEAALPGLIDLLEVPALSSALWQAPGPAQQLAAPAPLAGPLMLPPAPPAEQLPLGPALPSELLGSSSGSLQAVALHQYPTAQHLQQQAVQAQPLAHAPAAVQLAQQALQAQQAQQAAALAQLQGHPMALMQHMQAQQAQQAQQAMALMPAPAPMPVLPYVSPGTVHRISLKLFGCAPHELGPDIRAELESMLCVSVEAVEAAIRPGCVFLTADLFLAPKASAAATMVSAAQLLAALRCPSALGAAAGNAALLQWQGGVAGTEGGTAGVVTLQHAEPQLVVHPACIAAPATGQLGPLVRLELQLLHQHGSTAHGSDPLAGGTVVCRQAGRHLPVEVWGSAATEAAALAAVGLPEGGGGTPPSSDDDSNDEGGSDCDVAELADSRGMLERPWSSSSSEQGGEAASDAAGAAVAAGVWVRPVGLHPGRCEVEVQVPLAGFAVGAAGSAICRPVLLSSAAPLLVLPCDAAAAEVCAFLARCSEQPEAPCVNDLLSDIGTAVGFLWQQQQQGDEWPGSEGVDVPPHFVAAAAAAAAEHVQHIGGMPRLLALVQRAAAAAAAACEAGELVTGQAAGLAQSMEAELASRKSSSLGSPLGSGPSSSPQQAAAAAADGGSYFDGGDEESSQHCTPPEQLAAEAASWGPLAQQARIMPAARWARWAAAIIACFFAVLLVRLMLLAAHAPVQGSM